MVQKKEKTSSQISLTAIVLAKNEEKNLPDCLDSISWVDEILVIDTGSTDLTKDIAKKKGARVVSFNGGSFSDWRNKGKAEARGEWILYIDADERMTNDLQEELIQIIQKNKSPYAYAVPRKNIILGKVMKHGGQWPDYQMRFFKKSKLKAYKNDLHEVAEFEGPEGKLKNSLIHLKHGNLSDMVTKTNKWSHIEAKLLYDSGHPKMVWWRFIRIMLTELWIRLIKQGGILDGHEGIIYAFYQMWSRFITYGKLWEMQLTDTKTK